MTVTDPAIIDEIHPDDQAVEPVTATLAVDGIIELFELLAFCHKLCVTAPDHINAAVTSLAVNDYNAHLLGVELDELFRRLYRALT